MDRLALPMLLLASACCHQETSTAAPATATPVDATLPEAPVESIGVATMEPDRTIVLQLRATGPGLLGDTLLRYPPDHAQYAEILAHVGPLEPGQSRPVAPFP